MANSTRLTNEVPRTTDHAMESTHQLPHPPMLPNRMDFVLRRCADKRVLHVGCVDAGLEEERLANGQLLHQRLSGVARDLCGVDSDEKGVRFLREHGIKDPFLGDICGEDWLDDLNDRSFDVIVASEVIEHLASPGLFLTNVQTLMERGSTELIVTVPNAFGLTTLRHMLDGVEYVNPDHNYWFSYYTITNLLRKHGFDVADVLVYSHRPSGSTPRKRVETRGTSGAGVRSLIKEPSLDRIYARVRRSMSVRARRYARSLRSLPRRALTGYLYKRSPFWGDGIVVVARLGVEAADAPTPIDERH